MAYGVSRAKGLIGATAASLHHSNRNVGSKQHLQPTPHLTSMPDPYPLSEVMEQTCNLMVHRWIHFLCTMMGTPIFFFISLSFLEVELTYNVVIISAVQECDLVIHIHTSVLLQILFPYRSTQNAGLRSLGYTPGPHSPGIHKSHVHMPIPYP